MRVQTANSRQTGVRSRPRRISSASAEEAPCTCVVTTPHADTKPSPPSSEICSRSSISGKFRDHRIVPFADPPANPRLRNEPSEHRADEGEESGPDYPDREDPSEPRTKDDADEREQDRADKQDRL